MIETDPVPEADTSSELTAEDRRLAERVERALSNGQDLKRWWDDAEAHESYEGRFELSRSQNSPDSSFGFFGEATVDHEPMPVMGNVQEMFYDRPKTPQAATAPAAERRDDQLTVSTYPHWLNDQVREYVLRYFMRTSAFREPESYPDLEDKAPPPDYLRPLSWRPERKESKGGFGFEQLLYKRQDNGEIGKFSDEDRNAIVDMREIGDRYEWILLKVLIFDFKFAMAPMGTDAPHMVMPVSEESYLAVSREFILNQTNPVDGELGRFGVGYTFVKNEEEGVLGYGPGHFDAAFQVINFHVRENGEIRSRMTFVANRPNKIANVSLDPVNWSMRMADMMSMGTASGLMEPVRNAWEKMPRPGGVDVVSAYISLANMVTGGMAERELNISKAQLERNFLLQHFTQHYNTIAGSVFTWRQIPDWLDRQALPDWVIRGEGFVTESVKDSSNTGAARSGHYDIVILGGGLAGLTLARHLLLDTDKTVLLLEKRSALPPRRQKYGESSVQLAGYYYSKVLDLEEYLMREHFMKYNLRFYWKGAGRDNRNFEDFSHSFIRPFSNIASYQLNRNTFEGEVCRRNVADPRFTLDLSVTGIDVDLADDGPHDVRYTVAGAEAAVTCDWVVDTSGRARILARKQEFTRKTAIEHGSFFWWVDGLVDLEKLTDRSRKEVRLRPERKALGHLPTWMATDHFMGEGLWFWVIPLQGKTSLGLVYDSKLVDHKDVFTVKKATEWVCREFPLFARDLPQRKVLDFGGFTDFAHDCAQTISPKRWAMAGEAGRFSDPLYSPGSDLISIYNTLIVDAIQTDDQAELESKCQLYEQLMRSVFQAYIPTYATSYDCLGDQETFSFKYVWELTVYFAGYVFPFINDMFTDRRFLLAFMRLFGKLGPINSGVQKFLSDYYQWKKVNRAPQTEPKFFDFMEVATLARAEKTFYEVGVSVEQARTILADQVANLEVLARFIYAHVSSVVLQDDRVLTHRAFIEGIDPARLRFDPDDMRRRFETASAAGDDGKPYAWALDPHVARCFRTDAVESPTRSEAVR